jgi:RNA polymerase sigma factor (sigma-70 family)
MAKKEVHSHKKQASDTGADELLTEAQISNREFLESVYGRQLRAFAETLFKGKTYGGDGPDDVVQGALGNLIDHKEEWQGRTVKSLRARLYKSVKNDFIDLTRKYGKRHAELEEADTAARRTQPAKAVLEMVHHQSLLRYVKQRVPNVRREHRCIDLMFAKYTVEETAEELGMSVDRVKKMRARILEAIGDVTTPDMIRAIE